MDQNSTIDNDLQKAIDDITHKASTDPVFSDPVAAPSSVPEGDTGELDEAVGPFPAPEPITMPVETPATETTIATEAQFIETPLPEPITQAEINTVEIEAPAPLPEPMPVASNYEPILPPAPSVPEPTFEMPRTSTQPLGMQQIKEAALRDLVPLLDRLNMNPSQKFNLYRDIFEDLRDYTVLEKAYRAATDITNEQERAEALLYLVESIDKM